jgi:hypothetical protein
MVRPRDQCSVGGSGRIWLGCLAASALRITHPVYAYVPAGNWLPKSRVWSGPDMSGEAVDVTLESCICKLICDIGPSRMPRWISTVVNACRLKWQTVKLSPWNEKGDPAGECLAEKREDWLEREMIDESSSRELSLRMATPLGRPDNLSTPVLIRRNLGEVGLRDQLIITGDRIGQSSN